MSERTCFSLISGGKQITDDALGVMLALDGGGHDLIEGGLHAIELEFVHKVEELGSFQHRVSPEVVVMGTVGDRGVAQRQRGRRENGDGRRGIALTSQDVEDDVSRGDAMGDGLAAGCVDRGQPVGQHRGENVDHLPIAVVSAGEPAPHGPSRPAAPNP